jgi:hypothetical protein
MVSLAVLIVQTLMFRQSPGIDARMKPSRGVALGRQREAGAV